jgi:histone-lysine N-methyltransferase SETMAR
MATFEDREKRTLIKMCVSLEKTPQDTLKFVRKATKQPSVSRSLVYKWHRRFSDGRISTDSDERSGRPPVATTDVIRDVETLVLEDRRLTVRDIADQLDISPATVHNILTVHLKMNKVCARWVPRLLTCEQKVARVTASEEFLERVEADGDAFYGKIITTDETWINLYDPETKQESSVWKRASSPPPLKAKVTRSASRVMFIFFLDAQGMLLVHAVPDGQTVNASYYSKVISNIKLLNIKNYMFVFLLVV